MRRKVGSLFLLFFFIYVFMPNGDSGSKRLPLDTQMSDGHRSGDSLLKHFPSISRIFKRKSEAFSVEYTEYDFFSRKRNLINVDSFSFVELFNVKVLIIDRSQVKPSWLRQILFSSETIVDFDLYSKNYRVRFLLFNHSLSRLVFIFESAEKPIQLNKGLSNKTAQSLSVLLDSYQSRTDFKKKDMSYQLELSRFFKRLRETYYVF